MNWFRFAALRTLASVVLASPHIASAMPAWMSEEAMRAAFIGKTLDGTYVDGLRWTETYDPNGRLDYRETARKGVGYWYFRGSVFCTFYDPGHGLSGGCWSTIKTSANCYEFYSAGSDADDDGAGPGPLGSWTARAWRRGEPSTCEEKPSV
jgi:hypothetical protein